MIVFERFYLVMGRFFSGFLRNFFYNTFEMSSTRNLTYNYRPAASLNICEQKEKFRQITIEEKRKLYKCGDDFVIMKDIDSWSVTATSGSMPSIDIKGTEGIYKHNSILNDKISIYEGDITRLEIDSIVNAANSSLLGGGGVDGVIHRAAGPFLYEECKTLNGCKTGEAKITCGYMLPAKHVIHTVGPRGEKPSELESCYTSCLNLAVENELRTIAFPCISTGVYGYPNEPAADVALQTVRTFLEANYQDIDKIIFCLFMKVDVSIYKKFLHRYFPIN